MYQNSINILKDKVHEKIQQNIDIFCKAVMIEGRLIKLSTEIQLISSLVT